MPRTWERAVSSRAPEVREASGQLSDLPVGGELAAHPGLLAQVSPADAARLSLVDDTLQRNTAIGLVADRIAHAEIQASDAGGCGICPFNTLGQFATAVPAISRGDHPSPLHGRPLHHDLNTSSCLLIGAHSTRTVTVGQHQRRASRVPRSAALRARSPSVEDAWKRRKPRYRLVRGRCLSRYPSRRQPRPWSA